MMTGDPAGNADTEEKVTPAFIDEFIDSISPRPWNPNCKAIAIAYEFHEERAAPRPRRRDAASGRFKKTKFFSHFSLPAPVRFH